MVAGGCLGLGDGVLAPGESHDLEVSGPGILIDRTLRASGFAVVGGAVAHLHLAVIQRARGQGEDRTGQSVAGVVDLAPDDLAGQGRVDYRAPHPLAGGEIQGLRGGVEG